MEWQIYSGTHSLDAMDINSAMVVFESGMLAFPIPNVNPPTAKRLSNVLAAYRLLDVLYALQSPSSTKSPQHAKLPNMGLVPPDKVNISL